MKKKLALISGDEFKMIKEISDSENDFIEESMHNLISFHNKTYRIVSIIEIFNEIKSNVQKQNTFNLESLINEYFNRNRVFLDYWKKDIKRDFNKTNIQTDSFVNATKLEYDKYFEYRFCYQLRNYIQHYEFPDISFNSKLLGDQSIMNTLGIEVKNINNSFDWKTVKNDLNERSEINLLSVMQVNIECLTRIHNMAMNLYDVKTLFESANNILEYRKFAVADYELAICHLPPNYSENLNGSMSINIFPFNLAEEILKSLKIK